jgi:hypothetical protein
VTLLKHATVQPKGRQAGTATLAVGCRSVPLITLFVL